MKYTFYVLKYVYYLYFLKSLKDETPLVFSILGRHHARGWSRLFFCEKREHAAVGVEAYKHLCWALRSACIVACKRSVRGACLRIGTSPVLAFTIARIACAD